MVDFFKDLSPLQWVMIGAGVVILFPYVAAFFKDDEKEEVVETDDSVNTTEKSSVTCLVSRWDSLYACCENQGLEDACIKLKEIFPMFLNGQRQCCNETTTKKCCVTTKHEWPFAEDE